MPLSYSRSEPTLQAKITNTNLTAVPDRFVARTLVSAAPRIVSAPVGLIGSCGQSRRYCRPERPHARDSAPPQCV